MTKWIQNDKFLWWCCRCNLHLLALVLKADSRSSGIGSTGSRIRWDREIARLQADPWSADIGSTGSQIRWEREINLLQTDPVRAKDWWNRKILGNMSDRILWMRRENQKSGSLLGCHLYIVRSARLITGRSRRNRTPQCSKSRCCWWGPWWNCTYLDV